MHSCQSPINSAVPKNTSEKSRDDYLQELLNMKRMQILHAMMNATQQSAEHLMYYYWKTWHHVAVVARREASHLDNLDKTNQHHTLSLQQTKTALELEKRAQVEKHSRDMQNLP